MQLRRRYPFIWLNKKGSAGNRRYFFLFLAPSFLGVMFFVLLPFADVIRRSFTTAVTGQYNGIQNYKLIFGNEAFLLAVKNTLRFTIVCIPLLVTIGLMIALPLSKLKHAGLIKALYLFPLAMPTATIVIVWKMIFKGRATFAILVFSYIWKNTGYTVILWLAGILGIPKELLEAAKVDGASKWQCLFKILLPNLKGSLYTIVILSFLNSFKIYREAYLVAGSYPEQEIYLLQHLFNNWFVNLDFDKMAASAVCVGGFLFTVIMVLQYLWDREDA